MHDTPCTQNFKGGLILIISRYQIIISAVEKHRRIVQIIIGMCLHHVHRQDMAVKLRPLAGKFALKDTLVPVSVHLSIASEDYFLAPLPGGHDARRRTDGIGIIRINLHHRHIVFIPADRHIHELIQIKLIQGLPLLVCSQHLRIKLLIIFAGLRQLAVGPYRIY